MSEMPRCPAGFRRADRWYETLPGGAEVGAPFLFAEQPGQDGPLPRVLGADRRSERGQTETATGKVGILKKRFIGKA